MKLTSDRNNDGGSDERLDVKTLRRRWWRLVSCHHRRSSGTGVGVVEDIIHDDVVVSRLIVHQVIQADGVVPELGSQVSRCWVAGLDDSLVHGLVATGLPLLLLAAILVLIKHEVQEVDLLEDVVDGHAVEHGTIRHGGLIVLINSEI